MTSAHRKTALARMLLGVRREEFGVAVSDAADAIRAHGGIVVRAVSGTLDAEDSERFFAAASIEGFVPKTPP